MAEAALSKFLGTKRWCELRDALIEQSSADKLPPATIPLVLVALAIAVLAPAFAYLDMFAKGSISLSTLAFGIGAVLALLIRGWLGMTKSELPGWKHAISLTHTAFAAGTIPAVLILALRPELLTERHDTLGQMMAPGGPEAVRVSIFQLVAMVPLAALWVGITEELIFRGLLVSVLRRWMIFRSQRSRDVLAITVSSVIFGASHMITWGPYAGIALMGLGVGFAIGYIASGERIWPVILYHVAFDTLSMLVALFV